MTWSGASTTAGAATGHASFPSPPRDRVREGPGGPSIDRPFPGGSLAPERIRSSVDPFDTVAPAVFTMFKQPIFFHFFVERGAVDLERIGRILTVPVHGLECPDDQPF